MNVAGPAAMRSGCLLSDKPTFAWPVTAGDRGRSISVMGSRDLTIEQAERLREAVGQRMLYVGAVRDRMIRLGFPDDDPLLRAAHQAYNGLHHLHMAAHYASCKHGVGLPS